MEQEQKHKQYEIARDQRYRNIMERLKSQEFCVNVMKKRHESDLETTRVNIIGIRIFIVKKVLYFNINLIK
jgi:hypothetical protein